MPESLHLHLIHNVEQERDALLGKPDAVHQGALAAIECMKQCETLQRKLDAYQKLDEPVQEGEGGTE